ncbi:Tautomerase enzyme [Pseudomonas sp. RIT-PI-q]|uniref:tautomerase family protein n=1 Tax=Pseudomonas sp. RIT-PI-q TaxID=1690247 RepID=UPI0006CCF5D2|nr:tautomerase family protein [Pseudomonas sp. RIT-PI-q]KPH00941.1 Tautomerase enzyme [Pseudomonas sp. RIT-PI-q]
MPMTHISMRKGKPPAYRAAVLEGIHAALHQTLGVHPQAYFMSVTEHDDADFRVNTTYPFTRSPDVLLIQITLTEGRCAEEKQRFYQDLAQRLAIAPGVNPADVFINLIEVASENWSPGNGMAGRIPVATANS